MKIDIDGLKGMYSDSVRQKKPGSLKDCPSPKKIVKLLRSRSSDKEATKIIDHVSRCNFCFSEFEFLLEVFRHEKEFIQEGEKRLPESDRPGPPKRPRQKILGWRLDWSALVPHFSPRAALILAGFVLVSFFIARYIIFRPPEKYRAGSLIAVKLVEPVGEKVSRGALIFRWKTVYNYQYYILELFDQALAPVWNSGKINEEFVALPKELTTTLEVNQTYFWMVTAYLNNGEKISSRLEKIILRE